MADGPQHTAEKARACTECGGPLSEARDALGLEACSGPCNAARRRRLAAESADIAIHATWWWSLRLGRPVTEEEARRRIQEARDASEREIDPDSPGDCQNCYAGDGVCVGCPAAPEPSNPPGTGG